MGVSPCYVAPLQSNVPLFDPVSVNPAFTEEVLRQCGGFVISWLGDGRSVCVCVCVCVLLSWEPFTFAELESRLSGCIVLLNSIAGWCGSYILSKRSLLALAPFQASSKPQEELRFDLGTMSLWSGSSGPCQPRGNKHHDSVQVDCAGTNPSGNFKNSLLCGCQRGLLVKAKWKILLVI